MSGGKLLADAARARAESRFGGREQRATDAQKALNQVEAAKHAEREKTAKLRALRLQRDAEQPAADSVGKPIERKARKAVRRGIGG